ncbi:MAG TPA: DUF2442 domain-containing protein [Spirochaetota bacterium]|nr:DUF2442 domain-containing protein [Spirochaetota bacterium]HRX49640.1 DUF2442 domain-containing protein [Spirochaetota bacterium]
MHEIVNAEYAGDYKIKLFFDSGKSGIVDFSAYRNRGGVFELFKSEEYFKKFYIDHEIKTLCWPDEIDFDPDMLYYKATGEPLPEWMKS